MKLFKPTALLAALLFTVPARAAEPCDAPGARDPKPLQSAIASDESVAQAFEVTAAACPPVPLDACDATRLKCGEALTSNLQRQINFDEGAWVRDMLLPYLGQAYKPSVVLPTVVTPATDVSCSADHLTLRAAALRRRQQSDRRKLVATEYGKWVAWSSAVRQACLDRTATQRAQEAATRTEAERLAAAAAAAKLAEEARQAELKKAEEARQAELKRQQQTAEEAKKQQATALEKAKREQEDKDKKAQAEAEALAQLKGKERIVAEREAKKQAAEAKVEEMKEREKQRQADAQLQLDAQKKQTEADHQKRIEELKKNIALTEAERSKALSDEQQAFEGAEARRREKAEAEIKKAAAIDRSDERLRGNVAAHLVGGITSLSDSAVPPASLVGFTLGGYVRFRQGIWAVAPADGMASGAELRAFAQFVASLGSTDGLLHFEGGGEVRGWWRRAALGLAVSFDWLKTTLGGVPSEVPTLALGPTLTFAIVDNPYHQFLIGARWMPTLTGEVLRFAAEIELGFEWFSMTVLGGIEQDSRSAVTTGAPRLGVFAVLGFGGRLRW